jgi:hypothetical protein
MPSTGYIQRKCACGGTSGPGGECAACRKKRLDLQRQPNVSGAPSTAPSSVHDTLRMAGQPLDSTTRGWMEARLGHDFSKVRVHTGSQAAASTQAVQARAYTVGQQIVFAPGQYAPATPGGRWLLAHELAHTVQQAGAGSAAQARLVVGAAHDPAEAEADRMADQVLGGGSLAGSTAITQSPGPLALRRQPTTSQPRGGPVRVAHMNRDIGIDDQARIHMMRFLCPCRGFDVTRTSTSTTLRPNPGVTYRFCRGRTTVRIGGEVEPSSFSRGVVRGRLDVNVAPEGGGTGGRVQVEAEARNTGNEPQVGGRVRGSVDLPPGAPDIGASGEVFVGTETGRVDTRVGAEARVGPVVIFGEGTDLQDPSRRGAIFGVRGRFGGPAVETEICRECRCPVVYKCFEDEPARTVQEQVEVDVTDRTRLRYYFRLNSNQDARDPALRRESANTLDRVAQLVAGGATVLTITGHASPEADEEALNRDLSRTRGERLHQLLAARLGADVSLPNPVGGGELLGRRASILPGSGLANAIIDSEFSGPEEVTDFLVGEEIENDQLADQFLALLNRVTEPADRLRLFGVDASSPIAADLLAAIEQFVRQRGRGSRPWDRIFEFLRVAVVEVTQTRRETRTVDREIPGDFRLLGDALCHRFAERAEREGLFGPAEAEPTAGNCPVGSPGNLGEFADDCDYSS